MYRRILSASDWVRKPPRDKAGTRGYRVAPNPGAAERLPNLWPQSGSPTWSRRVVLCGMRPRADCQSAPTGAGFRFSPGAAAWRSNLEPQSGTQTWSRRVALKPGAAEWHSNLEPQSGNQTCGRRVVLCGTRPCADCQSAPTRRGSVSALQSQSGTQTWSRRVVPKPVAAEWYSNLWPQSGTQTCGRRVVLCGMRPCADCQSAPTRRVQASGRGRV
jgi:hypothetical protein